MPIRSPQPTPPKWFTVSDRGKSQLFVKVYLTVKKSPNYLNYAPAFVCLARWFWAHWQRFSLRGALQHGTTNFDKMSARLGSGDWLDDDASQHGASTLVPPLGKLRLERRLGLVRQLGLVRVIGRLGIVWQLGFVRLVRR